MTRNLVLAWVAGFVCAAALLDPRCPQPPAPPQLDTASTSHDAARCPARAAISLADARRVLQEQGNLPYDAFALIRSESGSRHAALLGALVAAGLVQRITRPSLRYELTPRARGLVTAVSRTSRTGEWGVQLRVGRRTAGRVASVHCIPELDHALIRGRTVIELDPRMAALAKLSPAIAAVVREQTADRVEEVVLWKDEGRWARRPDGIQ